jgi:RNA polymerase sigma-70 factor, ECF subfamily
MDDKSAREKQLDEYHRLLFRNQRQIYTYILSLVGNYPDTDDLMQDTISTMWTKFEDFRPGSDFVAWGVKIAHYKILDYRRQKHRDGKVQLYGDTLFESLPLLTSEVCQQFEDRIDNLKNCLSRLNTNYLTVLRLKYFEDVNAGEIAKRVGLSISNVYTRLSRAHGLLLDCLKKTS